MSDITLNDFNLVEKTIPHNKTLWGKVICRIKNNSTGEIVDYLTEDCLGQKTEPFNWTAYWWEEGNGSCDCNRELMFKESKGITVIETPSCGGSRYSIQLLSEKTKKILYKEF